jgi:hypothetical protein
MDIIKYSDFDKLNELKFWDSLKNKVGKFFSDIDKKITDKITSVGQKFQQAKTPKEQFNIVSNELNITDEAFETDLSSTSDILKIRKIYKDYISKIYLMNLSVSDWIKNPDLNNYNIFNKTNYRELLAYNEAKNFNAKISTVINNLFLKSKNLSENLSEDEKNKIEQNADINKTVIENNIVKYTDFLFEADENNQNDNKDNKEANEIVDQGETQGGNKGNNETQGGNEKSKIDVFKTNLLNDFKKIIEINVNSYKTILLSNQQSSNQNQQVVSKAIKDIAASMPDSITKNDESKEKILKQLSIETDKAKLLKIRDVLGLTKDDAPL